MPPVCVGKFHSQKNVTRVKRTAQSFKSCCHDSADENKTHLAESEVVLRDTKQLGNINTAAHESFESCCHISADENKTHLAESVGTQNN